MSRGHRRADGSLRPTYQRARARRKRLERELKDKTPERQAWLANFDPIARSVFFRDTDQTRAIFLRGFSRELGLEQSRAAPLLEHLADAQKWLKLKTRDGLCVGAAPLNRRGKRKART